MQKAEKEVEQVLLNNEKLALKQLQDSYTKALADVKGRLRLLQAREETQSTIYQMNYQTALERQINAILGVLQQDNIATVQDFLNHMYEDGYLSIQYSLMQQGIPVLTAISQEEVTKTLFRNVAAMNFADRLGVNMKDFKQIVKDTITRGIATGSTYSQIAQQLSLETGESLSKSYRIARTEGHRVTSEAKLTSIKKAKKQGADVVKQWDATLDGKTRKHHRKLDGVWVEENEYFEVNGHKAKAPGKFGRKEEDINCRCILLTRPRWAVEKETTRTKSAKVTDEYGKEVEQLVNVKNYDDYKKGYYKILNDNPNIEKQLKNINVNLKIQEEARKSYNKIANIKYSDKFNEQVDIKVKTNLEKITNDLLNKYPNVVGENNTWKTFVMKENTLANADKNLNPNYFSDYNKAVDKVKELRKKGYLVNGGDEIEQIIAHEIGHDVSTNLYRGTSLDKILTEKGREKYEKAFYKKVKEEYQKRTGKEVFMKDLSEYAGKSVDEFFSEAFAEYTTSPKPSLIAEIFGKIFEEEYKKIKVAKKI